MAHLAVEVAATPATSSAHLRWKKMAAGWIEQPT
jgi:hypothetical protein